MHTSYSTTLLIVTISLQCYALKLDSDRYVTYVGNCIASKYNSAAYVTFVTITFFAIPSSLYPLPKLKDQNEL